MKLTIRKSDPADWYVIERAEHDGLVWLEQLDEHAIAVRCSSRFSDADVEGTGEEMLAIAKAIENRSDTRFRRCAVSIRGDSVAFWSPRNSQDKGSVSYTEAVELAALIRKELQPTEEETYMHLDFKVHGILIKNKDNTIIPEDEFIVFRPHDNAVPAMLKFYGEECARWGAEPAQLSAVLDLIGRVAAWRAAHPERCKVADVQPGELST
jgi:hypothetical protein